MEIFSIYAILEHTCTPHSAWKDAQEKMKQMNNEWALGVVQSSNPYELVDGIICRNVKNMLNDAIEASVKGREFEMPVECETEFEAKGAGKVPKRFRIMLLRNLKASRKEDAEKNAQTVI